jgi:hypothetical protein
MGFDGTLRLGHVRSRFGLASLPQKLLATNAKGHPSAWLRKLIASSSKRYSNIDNCSKRRRSNMAVLPV